MTGWDTTEGFFSRWVVVPFNAFFPAGKADPHLISRLTARSELSGLLRAAVGGLQQVMRRGAFINPPSVRAATARFRLEADPLRGFISDKVELVSNRAFVPRAELYAEYCTWAAINGFQQMSASRFYEATNAAAIDMLGTALTLVKRDGIAGYVHLTIKR